VGVLLQLAAALRMPLTRRGGPIPRVQAVGGRGYRLADFPYFKTLQKVIAARA
jgi:hypothetical protein